jgi:protein SCO1/2
MPWKLFASILSAASVSIVAASCGSGTPGPPPPSLGLQLDRSIPPSIRNLPLTTDTGAITSLYSYRGKFVLLTDFLTLCQDVCPLTSSNYALMDKAVASAGLSKKVEFVELTVDPRRDSPARLNAYRRLYDAPTNWSLLTASAATIAAVWKFFHVYYAQTPEDDPPGIDWLTGKPLTYDVDHEDVLAYLDPSGHERYVIEGLPNTQGREPPPSLEKFLSDLGRQHLSHPARDTWTVSQALRVLSWLVGKNVQPPS